MKKSSLGIFLGFCLATTLFSGIFFMGCASEKSPDVSVPPPEQELPEVALPKGLAYRLTKDKNAYEIYAINSALVKKFSGTVQLSSSYRELPVTGLAENTFADCASIEEVVFPAALEDIGDSCFSGCKALEKVEVPNSLTKIGDSAFSGCRSLTAFNFPEGLLSIGESAFQDTKLTAADLPDGITKIEPKTFSGCSYLSEVRLPQGLRSIGESAFKSTNLTVADLPDGITKIEPNTFYGCGKLSEVRLPQGLRSIGDSAFKYANSLSKIEFPQGFLSIDTAAFFSAGLTEVEFPQGLLSIGKSAFEYSSLQRVSIPKTVRSIGEFAFQNCHIESLILPESVETIGKLAFGAITIYTDAKEEKWGDLWGLDDEDFFNPELSPYRNSSGNCFYGAELAEEDGTYYVRSIPGIPYINKLGSPYEDDKPDDNFVAKRYHLRLPVRNGYTFKGWSTEEGSDRVDFGVATYTVVSSYSEESYKCTLSTIGDWKRYVPNTVLYAVWEPKN